MNIKSINTELAHIKQELTTIQKDGNIIGRTIARIGRQLEMGAKKIAHFVTHNGEWKNNQERMAERLSSVMDGLATDVRLTKENISKLILHHPNDARVYQKSFQDFSEGIPTQIYAVKLIIKDLKKHSEKVDSSVIKTLENQVNQVVKDCKSIGSISKNLSEVSQKRTERSLRKEDTREVSPKEFFKSGRELLHAELQKKIAEKKAERTKKPKEKKIENPTLEQKKEIKATKKEKSKVLKDKSKQARVKTERHHHQTPVHTKTKFKGR